MSDHAEIGLVGLGVMGRNLALNFADHGHRVAVHDREPGAMQALAATVAPRDRFTVHATLGDLCRALVPPRAILLLVPAGQATETAIDDVVSLLAPGDVVIDGGNSHFRDTIRRAKALDARGLHFLGVGISGGADGARHGPSLMVGGSPAGYARIERLFDDIAARTEDGPACAYLGGDGAGHFVKTIHNGIEYAQMQAIAEAAFLMRRAAGLAAPDIAATLAGWNSGELGSYLLEITADILGRRDRETGQPLVDIIADRAGHKGTGAWASIAALELGIAAPTIAEAAFARAVSADPARDARTSSLPADHFPRFGETDASFVPAVHDALLGATLSIYGQGLAVLDAARSAYRWSFDLGIIRRIWSGGAIIRARLLSEIGRRLAGKGAVDIARDPEIERTLARVAAGWRGTVAAAVTAGIPVPALSSALAHYDATRSPRLWTALIQAQRDFFGQHGFARTDRPGTFHLSPPDGIKGGEAP